MTPEEQLDAVSDVLSSEVHDLYHSMTDTTAVAKRILLALEIEPPPHRKSEYETYAIPYNVFQRIYMGADGSVHINIIDDASLRRP